MRPFQFYAEAFVYAWEKCSGPVSMIVDTPYRPMRKWTCDYYWDPVTLQPDCGQ